MKDLTQGNLKKHIYDLALPTIGGMLAFSLFNVTDTYFVGKLGTDSLAAMGFTFPVVMMASAISAGISAGAASLLARAYGNNNRKKVQRIATDGISLSIILVAIFSLLGLVTMDPLFRAMGASEEILPLIKSYMTIWYSFVFVVLMPPVSDGAMRAIGDTVRPFKIMLICAGLNLILDPIFIFGWFGFPALGIQGAAIATVLSRFAGMTVSLYYNYKVHNLIDLKIPKLKEMIESWSNIIALGVPSAGVVLLPQLIRITMTSLAATIGGTESVAAVAVGSRIEGFALIIAGAIGTSIVPLVGQNFGAKRHDRVLEIQGLLNKVALITGSIILLIIAVFSRQFIGLFTHDPIVSDMSFLYLLITAIGSMGLNMYNFNSQVLNALGLARKSLIANGIGTIFIILPLMYAGSLYSFQLMLTGLIVGQLILGFILHRTTKSVLIMNQTQSTLKAKTA